MTLARLHEVRDALLLGVARVWVPEEQRWAVLAWPGERVVVWEDSRQPIRLHP